MKSGEKWGKVGKVGKKWGKVVKSGKNWGKVGKKVCTEQTRCHHGGARSPHEEHRGSKEITRRCNSMVILTNSLAYQRIFSHHEMHTRSPRKCPEMQGANKEITRWYTVIVRHSTVQHRVLHFRLRVAIAQPFRDSVTRALVLWSHRTRWACDTSIISVKSYYTIVVR